MTKNEQNVQLVKYQRKHSSFIQNIQILSGKTMNPRSSDPLSRYRTTIVSVVKNQIESLQRRRFAKTEEDVKKNMLRSQLKISQELPSDKNNNFADCREQVSSNYFIGENRNLPDEYQRLDICNNGDQDPEVDHELVPDDTPPLTYPFQSFMMCILAYGSFVTLIYFRPDVLYDELSESIFQDLNGDMYQSSDRFGPVV